MEMKMSRLVSTLYQICIWITQFAYLNILWIGYTLLGGIVLGLFPSTVALYTIARKNTMGERDFPIYRTFLRTFRKEFLPSNGLGWLIMLMGMLWYYDLHFFRQFNGMFFSIMNYFMVIVGLLYIILLIYIFPVYVHYDLKPLQYIKQALLIAFLRPGNLSLIFLGLLATYYFYITLPGLIPLFGISLFVYFQMWLAFNCFESIDAKRKEWS